MIGRFDLVCANLLYSPSQHPAGTCGRRDRPHLALDGGQDGLELIRRFLQDAPAYIQPGGLLLAEIEASQGAAAKRLAAGNFESRRFEFACRIWLVRIACCGLRTGETKCLSSYRNFCRICLSPGVEPFTLLLVLLFTSRLKRLAWRAS